MRGDQRSATNDWKWRRDWNGAAPWRPTDSYAMQIRQGRSSFDKKRLYARYGAMFSRFAECRPKSSVRRMLQTKWNIVCTTEVHSYSTKPRARAKIGSKVTEMMGTKTLTSASLVLPSEGCKIRIENLEAVLESAHPRIQAGTEETEAPTIRGAHFCVEYELA